MIPGSNLLLKVQQLIKPTTVMFYKFNKRVRGEAGMMVNKFDEPVEIIANVQAVPRNLYARMGLDYNKRYIKIWASEDLQDLARDRAPDEIEWNNKRYVLLNEEDWTAIDNWNAALAIEVSD